MGWLALAFALATPADPAPRAPAQVAGIEVLADPGDRLRIEEVAGITAGWAPPPRLRRPGLASYWARVRLESGPGAEGTYVVIPDPLWEEAVLHVVEPGGRPSTVRSGQSVALADRPYPHQALALPLTLRPGAAPTLYLRLRSDLGAYAPPRSLDVRLQPQAAFLRDQQRVQHFHAAYAGLILAMVLYNLFLWLSLRDRAYLFYVLYAGAFGSIWLARAGLALEWAWPAWPRWNHLSTFYLIGASLAFGCLFVRAFLDTRRHVPRIHKALSVLLGGAGAAMLLGAVGSWRAAETLLAYTSLLVCLAFLAAGFTAWRRGYGPARIYLAAWGALIVGVLAYTLAYLGVLGRTFITMYGVQMGSAVEVLLLAFALGDRINLLRREKEQAQARYRSALEREVRERTEDLAQETGRLEEARQDAEAVNLRLRDANERLGRLSRLDELTGLANRRHLETVLDAEWRRGVRTGQPLSVILLDVDHFKEYNDEYGHLAGDRCLQSVAGALAERCLRAGDLVARFGGEEFLIVLPGTDGEGARRIAERLREGVQELAIPHAPSSPLPVVTISAGVGSLQPREGLGNADLLAGADAALYMAKRQGRNRVACQPAPPADGAA